MASAIDEDHKRNLGKSRLKALNPRKLLRSLVEAAGVEPASEKARRAKPTCVSGSDVSAAAYKTGKSDCRLVRLISAPWLRTEARGLSCKMTLDG
jgi:hypothetical protein